MANRGAGRDRLVRLQRENALAFQRGERLPIDDEALRKPIPPPDHYLSAASFAQDRKIDEEIRDIQYKIAEMNHEKKKAREREKVARAKALKGIEDD